MVLWVVGSGWRAWCCLDTSFGVIIIGFAACLLLSLRWVCCVVVVWCYLTGWHCRCGCWVGWRLLVCFSGCWLSGLLVFVAIIGLCYCV